MNQLPNKVEKRWDVGCKEKVNVTCPLCLQKWEESVASQFTLDDHLDYKDANKGQILRQLENGKCLVCKKTTSSYPNIAQQLREGKNNSLFSEHFHCCCGMCLEYGFLIRGHLLNTRFGQGCRILFSRSFLSIDDSSSDDEITFAPRPPIRKRSIVDDSNAVDNTVRAKRVSTKNQETQTQTGQVYESRAIKRNREFAGRIERDLRDSIRCDNWEQFVTLVSLYTEDLDFPRGMLLFAVEHNRCKYIEILMDKVSSKELMGVIEFAVVGNRCEAVRTLLCQFNREWRHPVYINMDPSIFEIAFEIAIKRSLLEMIRTLLDSINEGYYQVDIEKDPLYQAGFYGTISVLEVIFSHISSYYRDRMTVSLLGAYKNKQWATLEWILKRPHPTNEKLRRDYELKTFITKIIEDENLKILNMVSKYNMLYIDEDALKLSQKKDWWWDYEQLIKSAYKRNANTKVT